MDVLYPSIPSLSLIPSSIPLTTDFGEFYKLLPLTLVPIDTRPVIKEMLTPAELNWLNDYHEIVHAELSPLLTGNDLDWLNKVTASL